MNYTRQYNDNGVNWQNYRSTATPLSAENLNSMDDAISAIDREVYNSVNTKADASVVAPTFVDVSLDMTTGIMTFTKLNGTTKAINTALNKVVVNFTYDAEHQKLILELPDGTIQEIDLSAFITQYEFDDTATIAFTVDSSGHVSATIPNGSITEAKLDVTYKTSLEQLVNQGKDYSKASQSYARGDAVNDDSTPYRPGQETDNALYYMQQAQAAAAGAGGVPFIGATETRAGQQGLVPTPAAGYQDRFLKGDGDWANLPEFRGISGSIQSISGLVPAAQPGDENSALTGDGNFTPIAKAEMIANIEPSTTSTHAYTIGQQFILNGVLHIATAAISVGDTLAVGTNCAINQSITEQIKTIVDAYVTGVKGNSETDYRTGNVNLTKANIGLTNVTNYDQKVAIKNITRSGTTFTATKLDGTTFTFTQQDNNTWNALGGASSSAAGSAGYAPAPAKGYQGRFLRGDATWAALGAAASYGATTSVTSGSSSLVTSGGVYTKFTTKTFLGSRNGTGDVSLSASVSSYTFILVGWTNSNADASEFYTTLLIPSSILTSATKLYGHGNGISMNVIYKSAKVLNVAQCSSTYPYIRVYGIQ